MLFPKKTATILSRFTSSFSADIILSPENLTRCLKSLVKQPPMRFRMGQVKAEQRFASVLIPICVDESGETSILYTRRSGLVSRHVRQISFPGGIKDPEDTSFEDCALRETEEEIGLPRSQIEIWGKGPLTTPPHTAAIMPVYGTVRNLDISKLVLNEAEVDEAFTVKISDLASPTTFRHTQYKSGYSAPVFIVNQYKIWGITGFLTNNLINCLLPEELNRKRPKIEYVKPFKNTESIK